MTTAAQSNGPLIVAAMQTGNDTPFLLYRAIRVPARRGQPAGISEIPVGAVSWDADDQSFRIYQTIAHAAGVRFDWTRAPLLGRAHREFAPDWSLYGVKLSGGEEWYGYCDTLSFAVDL